MTIINCEQRTDAWVQARLGRLTGSAAKAMLATIKSGEAAARRDLRLRLVCERLTSRSAEDGYVNADMQRGIELEPLAIAAYEAHTGYMVQSVGFVAHPTLLVGCSPDGFVGAVDHGLIEAKAPRAATHLRYLRDGGIPSEYVAQVTHNLWVTGAQWLDFVSFNRDFPECFQLFVARAERDEQAIAKYAAQAEKFLAECELEYRALITAQEGVHA